MWGKLLDEWGSGGGPWLIDSGPGPALLMPVTKTGERYILIPKRVEKKAGDKPLAIDNYSTVSAVQFATWTCPDNSRHSEVPETGPVIQHRAN